MIFVSFLDYKAGLAGLFCVIVSNLLANYLKFSPLNIEKGYYAFNSLLVGLGMGAYYKPTLILYLILFFIAVQNYPLPILCHIKNQLFHWEKA